MILMASVVVSLEMRFIGYPIIHPEPPKRIVLKKEVLVTHKHVKAENDYADSYYYYDHSPQEE